MSVSAVLALLAATAPVCVEARRAYCAASSLRFSLPLTLTHSLLAAAAPLSRSHSFIHTRAAHLCACAFHLNFCACHGPVTNDCHISRTHANYSRITGRTHRNLSLTSCRVCTPPSVCVYVRVCMSRTHTPIRNIHFLSRRGCCCYCCCGYDSRFHDRRASAFVRAFTSIG